MGRNLRETSTMRKTGHLPILCFGAPPKRKMAAHKQETHTRKKIYPPEDALELRFLFLSHVKGLIRGSVPVRIRVSIGKVDALLALVRASAGLSLPDSRTTFCKVRLLSISWSWKNGFWRARSVIVLLVRTWLNNDWQSVAKMSGTLPVRTSW